MCEEKKCTVTLVKRYEIKLMAISKKVNIERKCIKQDTLLT